MVCLWRRPRVATTGVAALIAQGHTLDSGPGPGILGRMTEAFGNMKGRTSSCLLLVAIIWRKVKVLVIDEISMVDVDFVDWHMSMVPRGIQLVLCVDAVQLPPVPNRKAV